MAIGSFTTEEDIGTYTIKAIDDPRMLNKILYMRPPSNILSYNELVSLWENKVGKTFQRVYIPEEDVLKKIEGKNKTAVQRNGYFPDGRIARHGSHYLFCSYLTLFSLASFRVSGTT